MVVAAEVVATADVAVVVEDVVVSQVPTPRLWEEVDVGRLVKKGSVFEMVDL